MDKKSIKGLWYCFLVFIVWLVVLFFPSISFMKESYVYFPEAQFSIPQPSVNQIIVCFIALLLLLITAKYISQPNDTRISSIRNYSTFPLLLKMALTIAGIIITKAGINNDYVILISPVFFNSFLLLYWCFYIRMFAREQSAKKKICISVFNTFIIFLFLLFVIRPLLFSLNIYNAQRTDSNAYILLNIFPVILMLVSNIYSVCSCKMSLKYIGPDNNQHNGHSFYNFIVLGIIWALSKISVAYYLVAARDVHYFAIGLAFILKAVCIVWGIYLSHTNNNMSFIGIIYCILADIIIEVFFFEGYTVMIEDESRYYYNMFPTVIGVAFLFSFVLNVESVCAFLFRSCIYCLILIMLSVIPPVLIGEHKVYFSQLWSMAILMLILIICKIKGVGALLNL